MKRFAWSSEKNAQLIDERGISFERVIYHIERDEILDVITKVSEFILRSNKALGLGL